MHAVDTGPLLRCRAGGEAPPAPPVPPARLPRAWEWLMCAACAAAAGIAAWLLPRGDETVIKRKACSLIRCPECQFAPPSRVALSAPV